VYNAGADLYAIPDLYALCPIAHPYAGANVYAISYPYATTHGDGDTRAHRYFDTITYGYADENAYASRDTDIHT